MTPDQADYEILRRAPPPNNKLAVPMYNANLADDVQAALERAQLRSWIRLIDVAPIAANPVEPYRIFILTPMGIERFERLREAMQ